MAKKDETAKTARGAGHERSEAPKKRTGLGRGLGALIPSVSAEEVAGSARPIDVFFPEGAQGSTVRRGGSARDLLDPKSVAPRKRSSASRGSSRTRQPMPPVNLRSSTKAAMEDAEASEHIDAVKATVVEHNEMNAIDVDSSELASKVAPPEEPRSPSHEEAADLPDVKGAAFAEIPLDLIVPNSRQPREVFDEDDLAELSASIKEVGVLQPIVVRPISVSEAPSELLLKYLEEKPEARFELIMGERRLRASELAGLTSIPAIIRDTEDGDLLRDALLENLHRAQLNPLEEASAYQQLMADFGATQEELARRIARSRPQIANTLRLLRLPPAVQKKVAAQVISAGHARALLSLSTPEEMEILADRIVAEGLSVRTTEELVRLGRVKSQAQTQRRLPRPVSSLGRNVVSALQDAYDTRVTITEGRTKGRIVIEFAGPEDLQRIATLILPQD